MVLVVYLPRDNIKRGNFGRLQAVMSSGIVKNFCPEAGLLIFFTNEMPQA